jgi:hypothetical protein
MQLWILWWQAVRQLRPAFHRSRTFLWATLVLAAACIRTDLAGVTSLVRSLGLRQVCYDRLLDFFHSPSVDLEKLTSCWVSLLLRLLTPLLYTVNGHLVLLADGLKRPKAGRKMPAVKKLHQESQNNTKPAFIFGHSCQALALVVRAASSFAAIPLACRIHEGLRFHTRDSSTLLSKLFDLLCSLPLSLPVYLVADAYYAASTLILPLLTQGHHLLSVVRSTAVGYYPAVVTSPRAKGRPPLYGTKLRLKELFDNKGLFQEAESPVYGERNVTIRFHSLDLLWRPVGRLVRFVWVIHPTRGKKILLCTDLSLPPLKVIELYGVRFKIEVSFKQAIYTLGTYSYHFWMASMTPRSRRSGDRYLHRKSSDYRRQVRRKMAAYHCHIQHGLIAQGLLQYLSVLHPKSVWRNFGSWVRTIRPDVLPSEQIVAVSLRHALPHFLADAGGRHPLAKIIRRYVDLDRAEGMRLAG